MAQNAVEGLGMMKTVEADRAAKTLDKIQADNKALIIKVEMKLLGDEYTAAVAERYAGWNAEYQADPSKWQ